MFSRTRNSDNVRQLHTVGGGRKLTEEELTKIKNRAKASTPTQMTAPQIAAPQIATP